MAVIPVPRHPLTCSLEGPGHPRALAFHPVGGCGWSG